MRKEIGKVGEYKVYQGEKVTFIDATNDNKPYKAKILHIDGEEVQLIVYDFEFGDNPPQNSKLTTSTKYIELDTMTIIKKVMK